MDFNVDELKEKLAPLLEKERCDFAYLGGSVAANTASWWSDVDVFIHCPALKDATPGERLEWLIQFSVAADRVTGRDDIDVNLIDALPLHVQFDVISGGIVLYETDGGTARTDYIEWLLPRYYDHIVWYKRMIEARIKG